MHLGIGAHLSFMEKLHLQGKTYFFQSEFKYTMGVHSQPETWDNVPHAVTWQPVGPVAFPQMSPDVTSFQGQL
jgi:hypothetical protein